MEQTSRCKEFHLGSLRLSSNKCYLFNTWINHFRKEVPLKKYALVMSGGIIGALSRYFIAENIHSQYLAVFIINQLGVFFAGVVIFKVKSSELSRIFWISGFAGGFTTFSSFAVLNIKGRGVSDLIWSAISFSLSFVLIRIIGSAQRA
jgi:CrcB protein